MATLSLTYPDAVATRLVNGFCRQFGYQATINGSPNPESKAQFVKRKVAEFIQTSAAEGEASTAATTARDTARADFVVT